MTLKGLILLVFVLVYLFLVVSRKHRAKALWVAIVALMVAALFSDHESRSQLGIRALFLHAVNWNVLGIFAGTLILAELFIDSRVPVLLADLLIDRSRTTGWAMLWVCALSSFISIFVENVATVLIVAPVALEVARRLKVTPVPFIIGIAVSSNLQGTATLIGDPPSMLLAAHAKMNFNDFIWFRGRPSVFFAVQAGALASLIVLYMLFRKFREPVVRLPVEKPTSWVPTALLVLLIVDLGCSSLVDPDFRWFAGASTMAFGLAGLGWCLKRDRGQAKDVLKRFDWSTTFFLAGVFAMAHALEKFGHVSDLAAVIGRMVGDNVFLAFTCVVWFSVLVSAFIDNVPYTAVMLGVVAGLSRDMGLPNDYLLAFGLLIGACLGGNITPIGASANIVAVGILRREGHPITFGRFVKIGLPFTVVATLAGYLFIWLVWR